MITIIVNSICMIAIVLLAGLTRNTIGSVSCLVMFAMTMTHLGTSMCTRRTKCFIGSVVIRMVILPIGLPPLLPHQ